MFKYLTVVAVMGYSMLGPAAKADDQAQVKATIQGVAKAMSKFDLDGLFKLCAPEFKESAMGMTLDGKQVRAMLEQQKSMIKKVLSIKMTPSKITVNGNTATAMVAGEGKFEIVDKMGQMGPKGATHVMGETSKNRVTLKKVGGKWLFTHLEMLEQKPTMDGKPLPMQGGAPPKH